MVKKCFEDKGASLSSVILTILILILIIFLFYEIVYVDVFDLAEKENTVPVITQSETENIAGHIKYEINEEQNQISNFTNTITQQSNNTSNSS